MSDYVMGDLGRCATCGGTFVVKKDGTLRWHLGTKTVGRWRQMCDGAGEPPAPAAGSSGAAQ
jgi:hypothetical protein